MPANLFKLTLIIVAVLLASPFADAQFADAQGIRQGGNDTNSGLRQQAQPQDQMDQKNRQRQSSQRLGSGSSSAQAGKAQAERALRQARGQNQVNQTNSRSPSSRRLGGGSSSSQAGGTQAGGAQAGREMLQEAEKLKARFRHNQSKAAGTAHKHRFGFVVAFVDTSSLLKPRYVKQLKRLENMQGIRFKVFQSEHSVDPNWVKNKAKDLEGMESIMARDDRGGRTAKKYGVEKFPTVLYEAPNHEVTKLYVPRSLQKVFRIINAEKRKQRARR